MEKVVEGFKLSPQQLHVWALQRGAQSRPYRAACVVRIEGDLDPEALERGLARVVERHEILRTTFQQLPGLEIPLQIPGELASVAVQLHDLIGATPEGQQSGIDALLEEMGRTAVDLGTGPLLQASLVPLAAGKHALLLDLPALCADAGALASLVRDLEISYRGEQAAEPMQYADIAGWQNDLLDARDEVARKYWATQSFTSSLDASLFCERAEDPLGSFAPRRLDLGLSTALAKAVDELARRLETSAEVVLLSCWHALVRRLSGRSDAVLGVACDGRKLAELEGALGLLARYLPLRCELDGRATFEESVREVQGMISDLREWQEHFTWEAFPPAQQTPRWFPHAFEYGELPADREGSGVSFFMDRLSVCTERFRLKLSCLRRDGILSAELVYDGSVYQREDALRLAGWFRTLLEGAIQQPHVRVLELEILSAAERRRLLEDLSGPQADCGPLATLTALFEEQVRRAPGETAVVFRDLRLTYGELAAQARRLARKLRAMGVGPEVRVALCVERSLDMIVGILGILEAGGAWVPLDPAYPADRLAFMLEDARASVVLTQERLLAELSLPAVKVLCLDRDWQPVAQESPEPRSGGAGPDNLAYVIYTSGSTGRPKGVMVSHRAIVNRLLWMQRELPLTKEDRVLQKTPYSFDASIWEILLPLLTGARLVIAEPGGHKDCSYLLAAVAAQGVTILQLVPSLFSVFLAEEGLRERGRSLRRVFCGGEALPAEAVERSLTLLEAELCNLYGPTEAAIDATFLSCGSERREGIVPIGRPLDNVRVRLLDASQRLVPAGMPGEALHWRHRPGPRLSLPGGPDRRALRARPLGAGRAPL